MFSASPPKPPSKPSRSGNRLAPGDEPPFARRQPALDRHRARPGGRFFVLLLRGRRDCAIDLSQRRELHGCHGFRDGIHQPRSRAQHHPDRAHGVAVHGRGSGRRADHGRDSRCSFPPILATATPSSSQAIAALRGRHGGEAPRGSISRSPPNLPHDWKEQRCLLGFAA
jgi:hypothetical protein